MDVTPKLLKKFFFNYSKWKINNKWKKNQDFFINLLYNYYYDENIYIIYIFIDYIAFSLLIFFLLLFVNRYKFYYLFVFNIIYNEF